MSRPRLNMTPAQRAQYDREKAREYNRRAYAKRTAQQPAAERKARPAMTPEQRRQRRREWAAQYFQSPEGRAKRDAYKELVKRDGRAALWRKQSRSKPAVREAKRAYMKVWVVENRAHKQAYEKARLERLQKENPAAYEAHRMRVCERARRRYMEKRLRANANDPEALAWFAKERQRCRDLYESIKADPVRYAAWRERVRVYVERAKARRAADPVKLAAFKARTKAAAARYSDKKRAADPHKAQSVLAEIGALIPRGMPLEIRGDLINELYAALLAGEVTRADLPKKLKTYTARAWKLLGDPWKQSSLDDVIPGRDDGMTWKDAIPSDATHF